MIKQDNESSIMKKSILIVDDEPDIVNLTEKFLNRGEFKTITCSNGKEALKVIEERHDEIALILLDIMMPGKSGYDILREIVKKFGNNYEYVSQGRYDLEQFGCPNLTILDRRIPREYFVPEGKAYDFETDVVLFPRWKTHVG